MEFWFIILISISLAALLRAFFNLLFPNKNSHNLPPGPFTFPVIGNLQWLLKPFAEVESILRNLHAKFGPMVTLHLGSRPFVFVADRSLAHKALVQNGVVFADRAPALPTDRIVSGNQHIIVSASYGPTWRLLRRNLTTEILHPSSLKSYKHARKWVLEILFERFMTESKTGDPVHVVDHFRYALFCLIVLMCFGEKLDQKQIREIENAQRRILLCLEKFNILNFWPRLTRIFFRKKWEQLLQLRRGQESVLIPLIRARKKLKEESFSKAKEDNEYVLSYVDTLFDLQLPEEKRKLNEEEIVSLCSEFLDGGVHSTATELEWIMANLVKHRDIQQKLFMEIKGVIENGEKEVEEEELQKLPYLKAIILEGLRRHPPAHFLFPHAVTEDVVLDKYVVPKNGIVNFAAAEIGWDPKVWENPMAFKPERFLINDNGGVEAFDITGSREIKMMPFGVGRRICPGYGLAMLHLEYFVANLIWNFEWKAVDGDEVDLSEKREFTMVMKNPLQVHISPRIR